MTGDQQKSLERKGENMKAVTLLDDREIATAAAQFMSGPSSHVELIELRGAFKRWSMGGKWIGDINKREVLEFCSHFTPDKIEEMIEELAKARIKRSNEYNELYEEMERRVSIAESRGGWKCFNCNFYTDDAAEAAAHFGDGDPGGQALCVDWDSWSEKERLKSVHQLHMEIDGERVRSSDLEAENDNLKIFNAELEKIRDLFLQYDEKRNQPPMSNDGQRSRSDLRTDLREACKRSLSLEGEAS